MHTRNMANTKLGIANPAKQRKHIAESRKL